jgi:hypothetical protein
LTHATLDDVPEDDVGDIALIDAGALDCRADRGGAELRSGERRESAKEAADWRTGRGENDCVRHWMKKE